MWNLSDTNSHYLIPYFFSSAGLSSALFSSLMVVLTIIHCSRISLGDEYLRLQKLRAAPL